MDVNTTIAALPTINKPAARQDQALADATKTPPLSAVNSAVNSDAENDNDRDDTLTISRQGQRLSESANRQSVMNTPVINTREQAQNSVNQLVVDIRNNPAQALTAVNRAASGMVDKVLG